MFPVGDQGLSFLLPYSGILMGLFLSLGCQSVYYDAMEKMGYHKRDLMVSDVEKARDAQQAAKEQFKSALDRFTTVLNVEGEHYRKNMTL